MKKQATNQFIDGLVTDFHPLTAKNSTLTDALNATLVTTKGNEMVLQNDVGNVKIQYEKGKDQEDKPIYDYVQLSEGFIPIGIKEYGGIIYIVSHNPKNGKGEIGSFPSPVKVENSDKYILKNVYQPFNNLLLDEQNNTIGPLTTSKFNFDLIHPVTIEVQSSYDGSVNLILTDDKNPPRLINSRFSVLENGEVEIPKRLNNSSNLVDDENFELSTSLIKRTDKFPIVTYNGVLNSGNLKVGNYTLYFKYADDDGNETDFIAWSSMISIFKGNDCDPFSIDGGVEDMDANKSIRITLSNLDKAYKYIKVYYSRTSSAIDSTRIPQAYVINKSFPYEDDQCNIIITGDETTTQIPISELNLQYFVANTAKTQAQCQNILFLGNSTTTEVPYENLTLLSLGIYPTLVKTESKTKIGYVNPENYIDTATEDLTNNAFPYEYYNTKNIYYNVGYWNEEFYRLGIVYVLEDNTKTPVFNIIGGESVTFANNFSNPIIDLDPIETETHTPFDPFSCKPPELLWSEEMYSEGIDTESSDNNRFINRFGVIHLNDAAENDSYLYSIRITIPYEVHTALRTLGVKGYFIVRQKRIPTIVAQGFTLPWDKEAKVPIVTYYGYRLLSDNFINTGKELLKENWFFVESFLRQCSMEMGNDNSARKDVDEWKLNREVLNEYYSRLHYIPYVAVDTEMVKRNAGSGSEENWQYQHLDIAKYRVDGYSEEFDNPATLLDYFRRIQWSGPITIHQIVNGQENSSLTTSFDVDTPGLPSFFDQYKLTPTGAENDPNPPDFVTPSPMYWSPNNYPTTGTITVQIKFYNPGDPDIYQAFAPYTVSDIVKTNINAGATGKIKGGYIYDHFGYLTGYEEIHKDDGVTPALPYCEPSADMDTIYGYYLNRCLAVKLATGENKYDYNIDREVPSYIIKHFQDLYRFCDFKQLTAICPEFEVRQPYFNTVFTGTEYKVKYTRLQYEYLTTHKERLYNVGKVLSEPFIDNIDRKFKIISVTDNVPVVAIDNTIFKSVIGSEMEAYRFAYINEEHCAHRVNISYNNNCNKENSHDFNLVRGIYSPYLGIVSNREEKGNSSSSDNNYCKLFNIYYPDTYAGTVLQTERLFKTRMENDSAYYPVESIMDLKSIDTHGFPITEEIFNGDCFLCTFTHRVNRNFNDPTSPTNDHIIDPETWRKNYIPDTSTAKSKEDRDGIERLNNINRGDINAVKLGSWITIKVKSSYNLSIRSLDESHIQEKGIMGRARGFYPLQQASPDGGFKIPNSYVINDAFGATVGEQLYETIIDAPYINTDYSDRIAYSDIDVTGAFKNGYRIFRGNTYKDYTKQYGPITKLIERNGDLICVFEHGVALLKIREKAIGAASDGGLSYITANTVLPETPFVYSDMYGSQWADSVIKTPYGNIYGIDAARKKIWKLGQNFEVISDFRIEKFLVDNLTIGETDTLPYLGLKNIATHYNANKSDVIFTFYYKPFTVEPILDTCGRIIGYNAPTAIGEDEVAWNVCYNEILEKFETFYSWIPIQSANIDNVFYSFDRECSREILVDQEESEEIGSENRTPIVKHKPITTPYLWKHGQTEFDTPKPTNWYGEQHPFEFEFIVNEEVGVQKVYNDLVMISNKAEPESFHFTVVGDSYEFADDKPNMYYRQETTKELFQTLGSKISFNPDKEKLLGTLKHCPKSTIFPLYYNRVNVFNDIYDYYTMMLDRSKSRDYSELSGSEINWDQTLNEFTVTTHIKNQPIDKFGVLRGNSRYKEDRWDIQIPAITFMQKNEHWDEKPPIILNPLLSDDITNFKVSKERLPNTYTMADVTTDKWTFRKEAKIRDKYCKIRIRYSGEKLAIISAIITTFTISYA